MKGVNDRKRKVGLVPGVGCELPPQQSYAPFCWQESVLGVETSLCLQPFQERWQPWGQPEPVRPRESIPAEHSFIPLGPGPGHIVKVIPAKSVRSGETHGNPKAALHDEKARRVMENMDGDSVSRSRSHTPCALSRTQLIQGIGFFMLS